MSKDTIYRNDGRYLIYYEFGESNLSGSSAASKERNTEIPEEEDRGASLTKTGELRWNPLLREWIITATHRQKRTFKPPKNFCPLCPSKEGGFPTEVPSDNYDLVVFENKFPALQPDPIAAEIDDGDLFKIEKARGICEVVLFTPDHNGVMSAEPLSRFIKLVRVWKDRYRELGKKDFIDYVFIFENKGEEVGVTLEHPHGQIYAYPFIPPLVSRELEASREYLSEKGECLYCRVLKEELTDGRRVISENEAFVALVPFFARYSYEVHIYARRHLASLNDFTAEDEKDLARILKIVLQKYDNLYGFTFPYIMAIHQQPTDGSGCDYSHFHIEFYPPYRTENKLKYLAGSETGAGAYINNSLAEEKARELRETDPVTTG